MTEDGDVSVTITAAPEDAATAAAVAADPGEKLEYRLRCLRALAERWPDELAPVCETILARPDNDLALRLAAIGHLADDPPDFARVERQFPGPDVPTTRLWVDTIIDQPCRVEDDAVTRGAGLALAYRDRELARDAILGVAASQNRNRRGSPRSCGLALRLVGGPDTCRKAWGLITDPPGPVSHFVVEMIGYLGDDRALPALEPLVKERGWLAYRATVAISVMGTPAALDLGATVMAEYDGRQDLWTPLLVGWEDAVGMPASGRRPYRPLPAWARALSPEDARRHIAPLAEWLALRAKEERRERVAAIMETARQVTALNVTGAPGAAASAGLGHTE